VAGITRKMIVRTMIARTMGVDRTADRHPLLQWIAATRDQRLPTVADTADRQQRLPITEVRWVARCRRMVAVAAGAQCQVTAEAASVEVGHPRTVVAEVMRLPTEAEVAATFLVEVAVTPRLRAVAVATAAEAATIMAAAITVTRN
jgi:hypothetical protein